MNLDVMPLEEISLRFDPDDIRKSQLQEIMSNELIAIKQTMPPVENTILNQTVLLTYPDSSGNTGRIGFKARIQEITPDYRIILHKLTDPAPCDLRLWPRIHLDLLPEVKAFCHDKEIQVVDISGGGTHIILQKDDCSAPEIGSTLNLKFIFEKGETVMEGEILRKWKDPCQRDHVAIRFHVNHNINQFIY
jgi:hypothetical protein